MTGQQWLDTYGAAWAARHGDASAQLAAAAAQSVHDAKTAAARFWTTATKEQKRAQLVADLAKCRCGNGRKHNPRACNSCGPINTCLVALNRGEL